MQRGALLAFIWVAAVGCGSVAEDDVDPTGAFSVSVTNGANGCEFMDWMEGASSSNIALTVSQDGDTVIAEIGGLVGTYIELVVGSRTFIGTVSGNLLELSLIGDKDLTENGCTYRVRAFVDAELDGDVLTGTIRYSRDVDTAQPCAELDGCTTQQSFNGTRPPSQ